MTLVAKAPFKGASALLLALFFALPIVGLSGCGTQAEPINLGGQTMGTTWSAVISRPIGASEEELTRRIQQELDRVNQVMSTYDPASTLSVFNQSASVEWQELAPELVALVAEAKKISAASDGVFDVTVGPLVNLWGFGPQAEPETVPSDDELAEAQALVGNDKLLVGENPPSLKKKLAGVYVDLSSIAKGYGVDQVANLLEKQGISDYLVEIGGELRSNGMSPRGDTWRIGIERPSDGERSVQQAVKLGSGALATSGDYRNYYERDGVRYSHTLDALTGKPVTHKLASVSVYHASAALADGWATALMVLGEEKGLALAEDQGLAAYFLYKEGDGFAHRSTQGFAPLLEE